jgi:osmotically-inducible protein OsmY
MARDDRYPYGADRYGARRDERGPRGSGFGRLDYPDDERSAAERDYGRFAGEDDHGPRNNAGYGRGPGGQDHGDHDPYLDDWRRRGSFAGGYAGGYGRGGHQGERGFLERATDEVATWFGSDEAERRRRRDAEAGDVGAQHHRGKGPRGYVRSDERIREDIHDRLTDDPTLDASEIEVIVGNREVTLNGTVNTRSDKRRAEDIAEDVSGVTHVQNNLRVQAQSATGERTSVL